MINKFSTWNEIENVKFAFLPIGSLEQHGYHLPVSTDSIIASNIAERLADQFTNSYMLPLFPFSSSFEHSRFPGSVSLKVSTLYAAISDIVYSLELSGINKCVIITGHMGNHLLRNIAQEINVIKPRVLLLPSAKHWQKAYSAAGLLSNTSEDMHAGEGETSILMSLYQDYVHLDKLIDVDQPSRTLLEVMGMAHYTDTGTIGFPSRASKEKGIKLLNALVSELSPIVKEFIELGQTE